MSLAGVMRGSAGSGRRLQKPVLRRLQNRLGHDSAGFLLRQADYPRIAEVIDENAPLHAFFWISSIL